MMGYQLELIYVIVRVIIFYFPPLLIDFMYKINFIMIGYKSYNTIFMQ